MNKAASLAPPAPASAGLTETEAQRLERHRKRLLHALQAQDRRALRDLSWWMAAMLLPLRR